MTGLLEWNAFSARARETRQSAFLRMEHGEALSPKVSIVENIEDGVAPAFQQDGFVKPPRVTLIDRGRLAESLVSPRSAKEYGIPTNGAAPAESPESLEIAAGILARSAALRELDTGLYIGNLWYLNFSDRAAGRITGMTRFGTFWVERGRIVAPVERAALRRHDLSHARREARGPHSRAGHASEHVDLWRAFDGKFASPGRAPRQHALYVVAMTERCRWPAK